MSLEELLIRDQGISVHRKHINTLLTEVYKTFSGENPYFMKSVFTKKDVTYNLRTSNLLTHPKQIQKGLVFTLLVFVPVTYGISYLII